MGTPGMYEGSRQAGASEGRAWDTAERWPEQRTAIERVEVLVRQMFTLAGSRAHGWLHTDRVRAYAVALAVAEGVDPLLAELAALLHDVGRTQPGPNREHGARSAAISESLLQDTLLGSMPSHLTNDEVAAVIHAVRWHNSSRSDTPLLCILRDADMLDGLGAMGIMRALVGRSALPLYDPEAPFQEGGDRWPALYLSDQLLGQMDWYNRLNTETARKMADERFLFMENFVAQARRELAPNSRARSGVGGESDSAVCQARPGTQHA